MEPIYTKQCTHCGGKGKLLQEDSIRNESWYDRCKYCEGTGQESVYSEADYLKIEQEKRKAELLREQTYLKQHLEDANKKVSEIHTRLLHVYAKLAQLQDV